MRIDPCPCPCRVQLCVHCASELFLEEVVEGRPRLVGTAGRRSDPGDRRSARGRHVPCDSDPRLEQSTLVRLVLHCDALRNRFDTLEALGGVEMSTLFAAVQGNIALRAVALEVDAGWQSH